MNNIESLRVSSGLTQMQLSLRCGWKSQSRISGYERGTRVVNVDDAKKIAIALACTLDDLFGPSIQEKKA